MRYRGKNFNAIHIKEERDVVTIKITNPPVNALSQTVRDEIISVLSETEDRQRIKKIFITGEGNYFSAGADIKKELFPIVTSDDKDKKGKGRAFSKSGQALIRRIQNFPKPITAYIDGYALGGGLELALACHTIHATKRSVLGFPEITLGLIPGWGGTVNLFLRCNDKAFATKMIYEGVGITAFQAYQMDIINVFVPSAKKDTLPISLFKKPAPLVQLLLREFYFDEHISAKYEPEALHGVLLDRESMSFDFVLFQDDAREGIIAFLEEREPRFKQLEMNIKI